MNSSQETFVLTCVLGDPFENDVVKDSWLGASLGINGKQDDPIRCTWIQVVNVEGHRGMLSMELTCYFPICQMVGNSIKLQPGPVQN